MIAPLPAGLAAAWMVFVAACGWRIRPMRHRVDLMFVPVEPNSVTVSKREVVVHGDPRRRLILLGVAVLVSTMVSWKLLGLVAFVSLFEGQTRSRRQERRQARAVMVELPEIVDFYVVGLTAGLTVGQATQAVATHLEGSVPKALEGACARVGHGARLSDQLATLPTIVGDGVRPLTRVLVDAERHGVAIGDALERLSQDVRVQRRRWAEIQARRIPVKLLFPLVLCTLPAFVLLSIVPVLVSALQGI